MAGAERRNRERVDLGSELWVRLGGRLLRAECVNVSMSGALVELELGLDDGAGPAGLLGAEGSLELVHRCGQERLAVGARFRVMRAQRVGDGTDALLLGVHFTGLDTASSIHLYNLIRWQRS
jgi:hypothetical protein